MARVTVEDCVKLIPNRFELVMMATRRAREICAGSALTLQKNNDKNPVIALREIAAQSIDLNQLHDNLLKSLSRMPFVPDDDDLVQEAAQDLFITADESTWDAQDLSDLSNAPSSDEFSPED